jgi:hypothetical protein
MTRRLDTSRPFHYSRDDDTEGLYDPPAANRNSRTLPDVPVDEVSPDEDERMAEGALRGE